MKKGLTNYVQDKMTISNCLHLSVIRVNSKVIEIYTFIANGL